MDIKDAPKLDDWRLGLRHGNVRLEPEIHAA
jgi:hypothetical protein